MPVQKIITLSIFMLLYLSAFNQESKLIFPQPIEVGYPKLGSVKGTAGVIGNNYYILENDYGGAMDMKNNISTILTIYSTTTNKLKKRINLNELIASSAKEERKMLFYDVISWKGQLIGFYTFQNASAKEFSATAIILDPEGALLKDNINIGLVQHEYKSGSFLWQGGLFINGRNKLSAANDFHYSFTSDSSRIIIPVGSDEKTGNLIFKTYGSGLEKEERISISVPLKSKKVLLTDYVLSTDGKLALAVKSYKSAQEKKKENDDSDFDLAVYVIDTKNGNKASNFTVSFAGRALNSGKIALTNNNKIICFGSYSNTDVKKTLGNIHGFYALKIDPIKSIVETRHTYDLPDSVIESFVEKKSKLKEGIDRPFRLNLVFTHDNEGLYVSEESNITETTVRGSTGALNSYLQMTHSQLIYNIESDGKIKWVVPQIIMARNNEMSTRTGRPLYVFTGEKIAYTVTSSSETSPRGLAIFYLDQQTGNKKFRYLGGYPPGTYGMNVVEKTVAPLGNNEYIAVVFVEGEKKNRDVLSIVRFKP